MRLIRRTPVKSKLQTEPSVVFSPFLPKNISELLPSSSGEDTTISFVAIAPTLIHSLAAGKSIYEAAEEARIHVNDAVKLLATPQFKRYVEAYLSLGDLLDRESRLRLSRAILAELVANGRIVNPKRDALDILNYIRQETETKSNSSRPIAVQIINNSVPRPYQQIKEVKAGE